MSRVFVMIAIVMAVSFFPSMIPYRLGDAMFIWFFAAIPFNLALLATLIVAGIMRTRNFKPSNVVLIGSAITYFAHWLYPFVERCNGLGGLRTDGVEILEWVLYFSFPFVYWVVAMVVMDE